MKSYVFCYSLSVRRQLLSLAVAIASLCRAEGSVSLLLPGSFHGDEVKAASGERWLGLVQTGNRFQWRPVRLKVTAVNDPIIDDPESNSQTGKQVSVSGLSPVMLVRGLAGLPQQRLAQAAMAERPVGGLDASEISFEVGASRYRLSIPPIIEEYHPDRASEVRLSAGTRSQVLYRWPNGRPDSAANVVWAGDLDGDGKLDLLMELSDHYNVIESTLFLSSRSGPGELVRQVAVFRRVGC